MSLRPSDGGSGSGTIELDRASGWFTVKAQGLKRLGRRRARALWVRRERAGPYCRLGFLVPERDGSTQGSGQLPALPSRTRFIVSVERSAKPRRPGVIVLRGRSAVEVRSATPAERVCRR